MLIFGKFDDEWDKAFCLLDKLAPIGEPILERSQISSQTFPVRSNETGVISFEGLVATITKPGETYTVGDLVSLTKTYLEITPGCRTMFEDTMTRLLAWGIFRQGKNYYTFVRTPMKMEGETLYNGQNKFNCSEIRNSCGNVISSYNTYEAPIYLFKETETKDIELMADIPFIEAVRSAWEIVIKCLKEKLQ